MPDPCRKPSTGADLGHGGAWRGSIGWFLGRLADLPLAASGMLLALPALVLLGLWPRRVDRRRGLLHLGYGGEARAMLDKYGSLRSATRFNPRGVFDRVVLVNYPALFPGDREVDARTRIVDLGVPGPLYLTSAVLALWRMARLAREESVRCVRPAELPHLLPFALALGALRRCPVVMSIHADWETRAAHAPGDQMLYGAVRIRRLLESLLYPWVDEAWPVFRAWEGVALRRGIPRRRIRHFPEGMDLSGFSKGVAEEGRPAVAWISRLSRDVYAHHLPDIIERTLAKSSPVFLVAGRGTAEAWLHREVVRRGLSHAVRFLGFVPREEVPRLLASARVALCLSGGRTTLEMLASGRPLVTYDAGWNRETVAEGERGFVVPAGDVAACAGRIVWVLDHPGKAAAMGERARRWVLENHAVERVDDLHAGLYRSVMARHAGE